MPEHHPPGWCIEPPICPPPGGGNGGDIHVHAPCANSFTIPGGGGGGGGGGGSGGGGGHEPPWRPRPRPTPTIPPTGGPTTTGGPNPGGGTGGGGHPPGTGGGTGPAGTGGPTGTGPTTGGPTGTGPTTGGPTGPTTGGPTGPTTGEPGGVGTPMTGGESGKEDLGVIPLPSYEPQYRTREFISPNPNSIIYDSKYNYNTVDDGGILGAANATRNNNRTIDPGGLFNSEIPKTLSDIIELGKGGSPSFNGITLGSTLYTAESRSNLASRSFNSNITKVLNQIKNANLTSLNTDSYLKTAIHNALVNGDADGYSQNFLNKITEGSQAAFPKGTPQPPQERKREIGEAMLLQHRKSLNPLSYPGDGNTQRDTRLHYVVPKDIDLCYTVTTQSGKKTGIRVSNSNTIQVVKKDLSIATIHEKNEYYPIIKRDDDPNGERYFRRDVCF